MAEPKYVDRHGARWTWSSESASPTIYNEYGSPFDVNYVQDRYGPLRLATDVDALAAAEARGRQQAAADIRRAIVAGAYPDFLAAGARPRAKDLAEWAARIAEGAGPITQEETANG